MFNMFNQDQFDKMTQTATKQAEDMMNMSQAGVEAWMKSTNTMMDGTANMLKALSSMSNKTREKQTAKMKEFMSCKTLNDMTETSTKMAQETMEETMSNATQLSEQAIKICMETAEPLNAQMTQTWQAAQQKAKKAA